MQGSLDISNANFDSVSMPGSMGDIENLMCTTSKTGTKVRADARLTTFYDVSVPELADGGMAGGRGQASSRPPRGLARSGALPRRR
eukprot:576985-Rhodomonas_salina.1